MNDSRLTSCYLVYYKYQHPLGWATQEFKGFRACFVLYIINLSIRNPKKIYIMHTNIIYISTIYCITYYILYNMIYIMYIIYVCVCTLSRVQLWPQRLYSRLGSSVHGIFQARIMEWVVISYSRGSSWPRDWTCISCISCVGRRIL